MTQLPFICTLLCGRHWAQGFACVLSIPQTGSEREVALRSWEPGKGLSDSQALPSTLWTALNTQDNKSREAEEAASSWHFFGITAPLWIF